MTTTVKSVSEKVPSNGRWVWKDEQCCLEYISNNPQADKKKKNKHEKSNEFGGMKWGDKAHSNHGTRGKGKSTYAKGSRAKAKQEEETFVTLQSVKEVAYDMMIERFQSWNPDAKDEISPIFDDLYETEQFDEFLVYLLNFFQFFFEKIAQDNKPNPMNIEPSLRELKAYDDLLIKLDVAQRHLGQAYCVLVMGIGLEGYHHMACGLSRVSATYTDRRMYETLYRFCTLLVYIAFRKKEYELIQKEIGRMLRSDTFNLAIRVKNAPDPTNKDKTKNQLEKITPAEYRRLHPKRPAIRSIIHQRSPAVVSILPSPKEEAVWLFKRKGLGSANSNAPENKDLDEGEEFVLNVATFRAGIIGEPSNLFNSNLSPKGADAEDAEEEEHVDRRESNVISSKGTDRHGTAVSHLTTEALSSDEENE